MVYNETLKIFAVMKANYPNFYKNISRVDAEAMVNLWTEMFSDEPYELVGAAVKSYIATDEKGFPPNVGIIKAHIRKLTEPQEMTELEASNLIIKAISNSIYNSESEFNKLPPILQKLVGSPQRLRDWAVMDSEAVNSVVSSNIMRSFKALQKSENEAKALPSSVQNVLLQTAEKMKMIE